MSWQSVLHFLQNLNSDAPEVAEAIEAVQEQKYLYDTLQPIYGDCSGIAKTIADGLVDMARRTGMDQEKTERAVLLTNETVDEWHNYQKAKTKGRYILLPCRPGDSLYVPFHEWDAASDNTIRVYTITDIILHAAGDVGDRFTIQATNKDRTGLFAGKELGHSIFLTRKEAEHALQT